MRNLIFFMLILSSCGIKWGQRYDIAVTSLAYRHNKQDLVLVKPKEIKTHRYILNKTDTIRIIANRKNFVIRDISSKEIFLFQFGMADTYKTIHCDSAWNILEVSGHLGDVY